MANYITTFWLCCGHMSNMAKLWPRIPLQWRSCRLLFEDATPLYFFDRRPWYQWDWRGVDNFLGRPPPCILWLAPSLQRWFWLFFLLEEVQKTTTSSMLICLCASLFEWLTHTPPIRHGCSDERSKNAIEKCEGTSLDGVGGASPNQRERPPWSWICLGACVNSVKETKIPGHHWHGVCCGLIDTSK